MRWNPDSSFEMKSGLDMKSGLWRNLSHFSTREKILERWEAGIDLLRLRWLFPASSIDGCVLIAKKKPCSSHPDLSGLLHRNSVLLYCLKNWGFINCQKRRSWYFSRIDWSVVLLLLSSCCISRQFLCYFFLFLF